MHYVRNEYHVQSELLAESIPQWVGLTAWTIHRCGVLSNDSPQHFARRGASFVRAAQS
jgi:hypothetical protein